MRKLIALGLILLMVGNVMAGLGTYTAGDTVTYTFICATNEGKKDGGCTASATAILDPDDTTAKAATSALAEVSDTNFKGLWRGGYYIPSGATKGTWTVYVNLTNSNGTVASAVATFQVVTNGLDNLSTKIMSRGISNLTSSSTIATVTTCTTASTCTALGAGAVNAAAVATGAIDADAIAADAIGSSELADNAIDAGSIASGAIDADAIAADSIGASELNADAATEIATAVWASTTRTLTAISWTGYTNWATLQGYVWNTTTRALTVFDEDSTTIDIDGTTIGTATTAGTVGSTGLAAIDLRLNNSHGTGSWGAAGTGASWAQVNQSIATRINAVNSSIKAAVYTRGVSNLTASSTIAGVTTAGTCSALGSGSITAAVVATGAIDADAIATDAIGAAEIAASAITSSEAPNLNAAITSRGTSNLTSPVTCGTVSDKTGYALTTSYPTWAQTNTSINTAKSAIMANTSAERALVAANVWAYATRTLSAFNFNSLIGWSTLQGYAWNTTTRELTAIDEDRTTMDINTAVGSVSATVNTTAIADAVWAKELDDSKNITSGFMLNDTYQQSFYWGGNKPW